MKKSHPFRLGIALLFAYCMVYALSQVLTGYYEHTIEPKQIAAAVFFITIMFYSLVTVVHLPMTWQLVKQNIGLVIKINISTALAWLTIIYALDSLAPASALAIGFGVLPIAVMCVSAFMKAVNSPTKVDFLLSFILLSLVSYLCFYIIKTDLATQHVPVMALILSILLCVVSGIGNAFNTIYAKILNQRGFSASQVLSIRFYGAFIIAIFILLPYNPHIVPAEQDMIPILWITLLSTIIPIYFLQKGISYANPIATGLILPTVPILTFLFEQFDHHILFSATELVIILLISVTILCAAICQIQKQRA